MITVTVVTDETSVHKYSALTVLLSMNHTSTVCDHVVLAGRLSHKHSHVEVEVSSLFNTNTPVSLCDRLRKHSTPSTRSLSTIIWMTCLILQCIRQDKICHLRNFGSGLDTGLLHEAQAYRFNHRCDMIRYDDIYSSRRQTNVKYKETGRRKRKCTLTL